MGTKQKKKAIKFIAKGHLKHKVKQNNLRKKYKNQKNKGHDDGNSKKSSEFNEDKSKETKEKDEDMMKDMDVDEFLNAEFLNSDSESDNMNEETSNLPQDDFMDDDEESSSDEEDEALLKTMEGMYSDDEELLNDDDKEEEEEEEENEKDNVSRDVSNESRPVLTMEILKKFEKKAFQQRNIKGLKQILNIFYDSCHFDQDSDDQHPRRSIYQIQNSSVMNRLMVVVIQETKQVFSHYLKDGKKKKENDEEVQEESNETTEETSSIREINQQTKLVQEEIASLTQSVHWKLLEPLIRTFFQSINHLLHDLKDVVLQRYLMRQLQPYLPYLHFNHRFGRHLFKRLVAIWGESHENDVKTLAFLRIRELALQMPFPFIEMVLKGMYLTYQRNIKFTNESTFSSLLLMVNCMVEIYGLDLQSSYQHAFIYIRQLALLLRKAYVSKSKETFQAIFNWQYLNSLRVWTSICSQYSHEQDGLRPLIYPLSQLLYGVIRLYPTGRFYPLRFHCIRMLQQLSASSGFFLPTSTLLLEMIESVQLKKNGIKRSIRSKSSKKRGPNGKKSTNSSSNPSVPDFHYVFKISPSLLESSLLHDSLISTCFQFLSIEMDLFQYSIAFPEMILPIQTRIRRIMSQFRVPRWTTLAKGFLHKLEKRSEIVISKRSMVDYAPKDVKKLETFLELDGNKKDGSIQGISAKERWEQAYQDQIKQLNLNSESNKKKSNSNIEERKIRGTKEKESKTDEESDDDNDDEDMEEISKRKDIETIGKMNVDEFSKYVASIDKEDVVEDLDWSSDEE